MNKLVLGIILALGSWAHAKTAPGDTSLNEPAVIRFEVAKDVLKLTAADEAKFQAAAKELQNHPYAKVEVEGFADATGPQAFNKDLSQKRAEAVKKHLVDRYKINSDRVLIRAAGEARPAATNATVEGRKDNRRAVTRVYRLEPIDTGGTGQAQNLN